MWIMSHSSLPSRGELTASVHTRSATWAALLATLAVVALQAMLVSRPAAADQIGDLRGEAASISQKLLQDQLEVDAYQQQYSVISAKVASDALAITALDQQMLHDQQQMAKTTQSLRRQAVDAYMTEGAEVSSTVDALFAGNVETDQVAEEYTSLATGDIQSALDQLQAEQRLVQADRATLAAQETRDQGDEDRQAVALDQAEATARQLAALQGQVTGQLQAAIAAQAAAQAAKAKAAIAAAAVPRSSSTDPALNPFLQCVVQAESGGDYQAVSPDGTYMGAFQFTQATWNIAAQAAERPDLVGVHPNLASKADQDTVAVALYALDGQQPWLGDRCSS